MDADVDRLRDRAFHRIATVLHSFWTDAREDSNGSQSGHTGIFDPLIRDEFIRLGNSTTLVDGEPKIKEHLVPRQMLRNIAFDMFDNANS